MNNKTYHINEVVYCNSNSITGERCQIKSSKHEWTDSPQYTYCYTVYSLDTRETFEVPVEKIYPTKVLAEYNATGGDKKPLTHVYERRINSLDDLMNFAATHMQSTQFDEAALEAFKNKTSDMLNIDIK